MASAQRKRHHGGISIKQQHRHGGSIGSGGMA